MRNKFKVNLEKIITILIKILIFLPPLFFLPWTFEFFDFNKQSLLWIISPLIFLLWLVQRIRDKGKIVFKRTALDIPILTFLIVTFLSSIFSQDRFSSFFGYYGRFSDAWFGLLACVLFYFIIINFTSLKKGLSVISLIKLLFYSYGLILLTAFISFFGLWDKLFKGTNVFYSRAFNPIGGSLESLAGYSLAMIILLSGFLFFYYQGERSALEKKKIWLLRIIWFLAIIFLILVDFSPAWWGLLVSGLWFFAIEFRKAGKIRNLNQRIVFPCFLVILSAVFLILPLGNVAYFVTGRNLPEEVRLDYGHTALITFSSFKDHIILGSGLGTFSYDFSLYRPDSFNQSDFWQFRFDKGGSHILELLGTTGILGILSYFLILILLFYLFFIYVKKNRRDVVNFVSAEKNEEENAEREENKFLTFSLSAALLSLIFLQFFYLADTSLLLLFWVILAFLMVAWREYSGWLIFRDLSFGKNNQSRGLLNIIVFLFFAAWLVLTGLTMKYWLADFYARIGGENNLIKAVRLNTNRVEYQMKLAKNYLNKIKEEMLKPADSRDNGVIQAAINYSLNWAKFAARIRPRAVASQEILAMVYRDIKFFTRGSEIWAVKTFEEAVKLEPSNPVLWTELGKAQLEAGLTTEAEQSFKQSQRTKSDYREADFGLARVYIKTNKIEEALAILDNLVGIYNDERIFYERGRLYYNRGEIDKAKKDFLKVLEINPSHANALYSTGLVFELQGKDGMALQYFKKVLELNPDNLEVKRKVERRER